MATVNLTFTQEELQNEVWKPIPGYDERYEASSLGRVRNIRPYRYRGKHRVLNIHTMHSGYCQVVLYEKKKHRTIRLHKLIASAFIGPCPDGYEINHRDGVKLNNRPDNLEYVTQSENQIHAMENGLKAFGERNAASKLTPALIRDIRRRLANGESGNSIANSLGVTKYTIYHIKQRKVWKHVD
jgi:hypothetical protein